VFIHVGTNSFRFLHRRGRRFQKGNLGLDSDRANHCWRKLERDQKVGRGNCEGRRKR